MPRFSRSLITRHFQIASRNSWPNIRIFSRKECVRGGVSRGCDCHGHGECDQSGACVCHRGWSGSECQYNYLTKRLVKTILQVGARDPCVGLSVWMAGPAPPRGCVSVLRATRAERARSGLQHILFKVSPQFSISGGYLLCTVSQQRKMYSERQLSMSSWLLWSHMWV